MHTVILGAGISGLTAAHTLNQLQRESCTLYEQAPEIGGLCRTQELDGFKFDAVTHVLHFRSEQAWQFVQALLAENLLRIERSAWVYFRQRYVPYPFQSHLGFLPPAEKASCLTGNLRAWIGRQLNGSGNPKNFEEWIQQNFGAGIARHFMTPYNAKLWGLPPQEMSVDWVRAFVPNSSLRQMIAGLLLRRDNDIGYNRFFYYPERGGIQALVDTLGARVPRIFLNKRAVEVDLERKTVRFHGGQIDRYDQLISTIPLKTLVLHAKGMPEELRRVAAGLQSTSLLNITCCLRRPLPHSYHWIYFPEPQFPFFRLVFPSNLCPSQAPANCSIISAEVSNPCLTRQEELEERIKELLLSLGLIERLSDIALTVRNYLDYAYPIHDLGRQVRVARLLGFLKSRGVWSIGRFGSWRYSSIDDAIVEAIQAAREVPQGASETAVENRLQDRTPL